MTKLLRSNSKLRKDGIVNFSLPALVTCPMAGICRQFCFASKGCYRFRRSKEFRQANLELTRNQYLFESRISEQLKRSRKIKLVRIHDSGDFYSQEYLNTWINIARNNAGFHFYAYTKSLHLDYSQLPSNFKVIQSFGGQMDDQIDLTKPHARVFDTLEQLLEAGYVNGTDSDLIAANGAIKIGLIKH